MGIKYQGKDYGSVCKTFVVNDWRDPLYPDLFEILDNDVPPAGTTKRMILLMSDYYPTSTFTRATTRAYRTSDGTLYPFGGSGTTVHTWDASKDEKDSYGGGLRWYIVYFTSGNVTFTNLAPWYQRSGIWLVVDSDIFYWDATDTITIKAIDYYREGVVTYFTSNPTTTTLLRKIPKAFYETGAMLAQTSAVGVPFQGLNVKTLPKIGSSASSSANLSFSFNGMIEEVQGLSFPNITGSITANLTTCYGLRRLLNVDIPKASAITFVTYNLTELTWISDINCNLNISSDRLTQESIQNTIDHLADRTGQNALTLSLGGAVIRYTPEQIAQIEAKNWVIT